MSEAAVGDSRCLDNGEKFRADAGELLGLWLLHNISFSSLFVDSRCGSCSDKVGVCGVGLRLLQISGKCSILRVISTFFRCQTKKIIESFTHLKISTVDFEYPHITHFKDFL